jgi:glycosyltransferase involved in cell wall biosynthesis
MNTVSILIPSRNRPNGLRYAVHSVHYTAGKEWENCEVVLRVDSDDEVTQLVAKELFEQYGFERIKVLIGPRHGGYQSLHTFYTEAAKVASGYYIFFLNDDITLEGSGWIEQLKKIQMTCFIAPEFYQLNTSRYGDGGGRFPPCPIIPNRCWEQYGYTEIPAAVDVSLALMLVEQRGWHRHILRGLTVNHHWKGSAVIE